MDGNGETTISYVKILNHPIETTIYKWMFQVPGFQFLQKMFPPTPSAPVFPLGSVACERPVYLGFFVGFFRFMGVNGLELPHGCLFGEFFLRHTFFGRKNLGKIVFTIIARGPQ